MGSFVERSHLLTAVSVVVRTWRYRLRSRPCSRLALAYVIGRMNEEKTQRRTSLTREDKKKRTINGCLVAEKLSFLSRQSTKF